MTYRHDREPADARPTPPPSEQEFRKAGFTAAAANYPRPPEALAALKHINGLPAYAAVPAAWHYFPNAWCRDNWKRMYDRWQEQKRADAALQGGAQEGED